MKNQMEMSVKDETEIPGLFKRYIGLLYSTRKENRMETYNKSGVTWGL